MEVQTLAKHQINKIEISVEVINTMEVVSSSPHIVEVLFLAWLSDGHAKMYSPEVYMSGRGEINASSY